MIRFLGLIIVAVCLAMGLGQSASAQPSVAFSSNSNGSATLAWDGLDFVATQLFCTDGGSRSHSNPCPQLYLVGGPGESVIIEAATGSQIESFTCGASSCSSGEYDLSVDLTVSTLNGKANLYSASTAVNGSASTGYGGDVGGTETLSGVTGCASYAGGVNIAAYVTPTATPPTTCDFDRVSSVSIKKDFGLTITNVADGTFMQLTSITESFGVVPEPASAACLLVAMAGLAGVRARRRRS